MDLKSDEITSLKSRIEDLRQVMNSDIGASFKEAVQTEEMIKMLEIRLNALLSESSSESSSFINRSFILISPQGKKLLVKIIDGTPDPANYIFSKESPIAQILLKSKKGDVVLLRNIKHIVG